MEDEDEDQQLSDEDIEEHVYMFQNKDLIFLVLPLYSDLLTDQNIREEFGKYYSGEKKKSKKDAERLKAFLSGMTIGDLETCYRAWLSTFGIGAKPGIFPNDMFTVKNFESCMAQYQKYFKEDYDDDNRIYFFTKDPDNLRNHEAKELLDRIYNNEVRELYIPYNSYKIPFSSFTKNSLTDCLLPWLPDHISDFFVRSNITDVEEEYSSSCAANLNNALPYENTLRKHDPIDYVTKYVESIKKKSDNILSTRQKRELLQVLEFVFETPKLTRYYSLFNRALKSHITARRREYQGSYKVLGSVIELSNQNNIIKENIRRQRTNRKNAMNRTDYEDSGEEEDDSEEEFEGIENLDEVGEEKLDPLSKLLFVGATCLRHFNTIPKQYAGWVLTNPIIWSDAQHRLCKQHFHTMCVGRGGVGKNHSIDKSCDLMPPFATMEINDESERAKTSDQPQNGGVIVQNEPGPHITQCEDNLNMSERKKQADIKEVLSTSKYNYNVLVREKEPGQPERRDLKLCQTSLETCRIWSANKVKNRGEALYTRYFVKIFFESRDAYIVKSMVKGETIPQDLKDPELIDLTFWDLYTMSSIANIAISVGILEPPTIGIGSQILHEVLNDMGIEGLDNTRSGRDFKRLLIISRQFILADAIIAKYMCTEDVVKEFHYEDLIGLEREFYLKKRHLFLAAGHLSEQYMDPVKFLTIRTIFGYYLSDICLQDLRMRSDDDRLAQELYEERLEELQLLGNSNIQVRRRRSANGNSQERLVLSSSRTPSPRLGIDLEDVNDDENGRMRRTKKRRRRRYTPWVEESEQKLISFYKTLIKFDKLMKEMKRTGTEFREYTNGQGETYCNFNYIRITTRSSKERIISEIKQQMPERPMPEDVDYQFRYLGSMEHEIPVYLSPVDSTTEVRIADMYDDNNTMRPQTKKDRIKRLYDEFKSGVKRNQRRRLLEIRQRSREEGGCHIYIHHSLTNGVDPWIIVNSLKSKIENAATRPQIIFTAVPTKRIDPYTDPSDLAFVKIEPRPEVPELEFRNMNHMSENIISSRKRLNKAIQKRKRIAGRDDVMIDEEKLTISDTSFDKVRSRKIIIREDLDDYIKRQREEVLNVGTEELEEQEM